MGCNNKNSCVHQYSSDCVMYVGTKLLSVSEDKLKCGISITDVIETMDVELNILQKSLSTKTLDKKCFDFDRKTVQQFQLNQMFIDMLCKHNTALEKKGSLDFSKAVSDAVLDIECTLTDCTGTNTKTVAQLMQIFCNEIHSLQQQLNTLRSTGNTNNIYIPNS